MRVSREATNSMDAAEFASLEELERFRNIRLLHNHWSRPIGPRAYYWYLTFENNPELRSLAGQCQQVISFPYYDLTPLRDLHMTLDRVAFDGDVTPDLLEAIEAAAILTCKKAKPFAVTIGSLGGTPGAIGFTASPAQPIRELRDTLRAATLSVYPDAPVRRPEFHPHIAIAYANSDDVPAIGAIEAVEKLNATARIGITVTEGTLVLLERHPRSYAWQAVSRIPLAG
jgi:2'-5' RNA ligase